MEPRPPSPTHDPDHDFDPRRWDVATSGWPPHYLQDFQRIVANPFLAVFWLIALYGVLRQALAVKSLALVGVALLGLVALGHLLHYHCRDCGATGVLFRWRSHACTSVIVRQQTGRVRRFRRPNPYTQLILWFYVLIGTGMLLSVVFWRRGP